MIKKILLIFVLSIFFIAEVCASAAQRGYYSTNPSNSDLYIGGDDKFVESADSYQHQTSLSDSVIYDNSHAHNESSLGLKLPKLRVINTTPTGPIKTIDKIEVFVNKGVITSSQIDQQIKQTIQNFKSHGYAVPDLKDIRERVIEQLILQKIQLDLAARLGIKTNDLEVVNAINNVAQQQNMSLEDFKKMVVSQGVSFEEFQEQVRNQITIDKLKQREVDAKVTVNDDEVNLILKSETFKNRVDYDLSDIVISIPEQASQDILQEKLAIAQKAYAELEKGEDFYKVSAKYSNSPNALNGGQLGFRSSAALPTQILNALANLKAGGFTQIIKLPVGFFIFKVNQIKKHGDANIVKQYHVRHILIKVNELTSENEAHQKILSIKDDLNKYNGNESAQTKEFINLAREYSEDTSSINGGDIGWISKGDTVPEFEKVVLSIPLNTVSEPIRTPFGWHLLEVYGVRDSNLANDVERAEIRKEIREVKAQFMYAQWIRDIRDSAYVKMNHD